MQLEMVKDVDLGAFKVKWINMMHQLVEKLQRKRRTVRGKVEPSNPDVNPTVGRNPHARGIYPDKGYHLEKGCELHVHDEHIVFKSNKLSDTEHP